MNNPSYCSQAGFYLFYAHEGHGHPAGGFTDSYFGALMAAVENPEFANADSTEVHELSDDGTFLYVVFLAR